MKFLVMLVLISLLTLVSGRYHSSSDNQFSWHHKSENHQRKTDHSRWSPFNREDDSTTNDENDGDSSSSSDISTESTSFQENQEKGEKSSRSNFYRSQHESYSPSEPSSPSSPIVQIDWGTIEGKIETYANKSVSAFYGIPYAEPPVGKLRFRLPVRLEGRHRGIYNATAPKPACMQSLTGTPIDEPVSEDCLTMNIWVPREEEEREHSRWSRRSKRSTYHRDGDFINSRWWSSSPSSHGRSSSHKPERSWRRSDEHHRYPVLFYVYGSQFKKHSSTYNKNRGGATAALGKFIFVSFNYRLQSFGFAYGGDRHMPGNQALYDCRAALEWTRANIASFGGDPDKITLAGSSAGSELVAMLALSPSVSPFLFDQVILMSAVPMRPTSIESTFVALNKTRALAAKLGCAEFLNHDFRLTYEQLECLQSVNASDIAEADSTDDITILGSCPDFSFMPIYGDDFMPSPPEVILSKKQARRNVKIMSGSDHYDDVETDNYQPTSRAEAEEHLNTMFQNMVKPQHNISHELNYLYDYYFDGVSDNDTWTLKERLGQLIGDNMFQCPLLLSLEKWAEINPVHYYYFNYTCDAHANSDEIRYQHGPVHGDANFMFLGLPFKDETYSDRDRQISQKMINILADFVHKGEISWPPMLVSRRNKVLPLEWVIEEQMDTHNMKISPKLDICRFMAKLYNVYF